MIRPHDIGFKRGFGSIPDEGILKKYELNYVPNNALIEELKCRVSGGNHHFFYRIDNRDLYILARKKEGLQCIDSELRELAAEITAALKVRRMLSMVE